MSPTYRVGGTARLTLTAVSGRYFVTRRGGKFPTETCFGVVRALSPRIVTVWFGRTGFGQRRWRFDRKTGAPWDPSCKELMVAQFDQAAAVLTPDATFEEGSNHG